ncbi:MAG: hypothetical protein AAF317_20335 [Pseudomonadota bacterium]
MNERRAVTSEQRYIADLLTRMIGHLGDDKAIEVMNRETDKDGREDEGTRERTEPNPEEGPGAI